MSTDREGLYRPKDVSEEPLRSVIANVERLLDDARALCEHGSVGSALSLAILAFEEAGKGHVYDLDLQKTKRTPSWHQFRQFISAFVLLASLYQKYDIPSPEVPPDARDMLEARWKGVKTIAEAARLPIPEDLRKIVADGIGPALQHLTADQRTIFSIELRWVKKVFMAAAQGTVEEKRQSGIYVDFDEGGITSSPQAVKRHEVFYWMAVTERVLRILKSGDFRKPYGELAVALEAMPKPLPVGQDLMDTLSEYLDFMENRSEGQRPS